MQNKPLNRYLSSNISNLINKGYSGLVLGPRQVGKTTLITSLLKGKNNVISYQLQNPKTRAEIEKNPTLIINEAQAKKVPILFIDEAQKVPDIFDAAQLLIDDRIAQLILTGSSARKLRRGGANLLPGRIKHYFLDPLLWGELGMLIESNVGEIGISNINNDVPYNIEDCFIFGSLPRIVDLPAEERGDFLTSYALIYLDEEIRAEALSRKIGAFSRFLELSARESGTNPNYTKLSNESGVSIQTIKDYYQVLVDTLIVEVVPPFLKNARKRIIASPRYYFFDIGVRNVLAKYPLEKSLINIDKGALFEHFVMLEIIRRVRALGKNYQVYYWRTSHGAEVDCVIDTGTGVIPIEIKSSGRVAVSDLKGLKNFLAEYSDLAKVAYVVTDGERPEKLSDNIIALPWRYL